MCLKLAVYTRKLKDAAQSRVDVAVAGVEI